MMGRGVIWLIAFAAIMAAAVFGSRGILGARANGPAEADPLPVAVLTAQYQDTYQQRRLIAGRIAPAQVADVSFEVAGEIDQVLVDIGDLVEEGAPIAQLDPVRLELREREVAAQLAEAQAVAKRAEATRERILTLLEQGFATEQERDDADADRNAAVERVRVLRRQLALAKEDLQDGALRSPFTGYVVGRYVDAGAVVQPGQPIVRLNEQGTLEATIGVPEAIARRLDLGDQYTLIAGELEAEATISGIAEEIDPATRTRAVRLAINEDPGLSPGALVRLELFDERRARGVWIPMTALQEGYRGLWSVYVVADIEQGVGTIERKDIEITSLGDDRAFVKGTLEDGDRIVTTSTFRFVPGQKVRIKTDLPPGSSLSIAAGSTLR